MKNPLVNDLDMLIFQQPTQNLFWAPIVTYFRFDQHSCSCMDAAATLSSPAHRQTMGLLWSIAALTMVPFQFPTDRRSVNFKAIGYLCLILIYFNKYINLVSLLFGKLFVGSHKCSYDLVVREALILHQLTPLSAIKVALAS